MTEPVGYVDWSRVRELVGVSPPAFRRRLRSAGIETFLHPGDHRRRLVRAEDVERLTRPEPLRERRTPIPAA